MTKTPSKVRPYNHFIRRLNLRMGKGETSMGDLTLIGLLVTVLFFAFAVPSAQAINRAPNNLGLVGYWSMEDCKQTRATDFSGNGNHGVLTNFALSGSTSNWVTGNAAKRGCALNFDGSNDYVDVADSVSLDVTTAITISAWIKGSSFANDGAIVAKSAVNQRSYIFRVRNSGGTYPSRLESLAFNILDGSDYSQIITNAQIPTNTWTHVVFTWLPSDSLLYINGINQSLAFDYDHNSTSIPNGTAPVIIGQDNFNGSIDEVRIYNRALSATEVTALYNSGVTKVNVVGMPNGLVGYWDMDSISDTTAFDRSGQKNNGTLVASPASVNGKLGRALNFNGTSQKITAAAISATPQTVAFWLKPTAAITAASSNGVIMDFENDAAAGNAFGWAGGFAGALTSETVTIAGNSSVNDTYIRDTISADWHHLVVTGNGTVWNQFYLDGVPVTTYLVGSGAAVSNVAVTIGGGMYAGTPYYFAGSLDDVRVYNRALSAGEVKQLYNLGTATVRAPDNTGLVGYWSFNDGAGTHPGDGSGFGNRGVFSGAPAWTAGKMGKALSFDGVDDYVQVPYAVSNAPTAVISYGGWAKFNSFSGYNTIVSKTEGGGYRLGTSVDTTYCTNAEKICSRMNIGGTYYDTEYATSNLSAGTWYHAFVTYDGETVVLYINGVSVATNTNPSGAITYTVTNPVCLGGEASDTHCASANGYMNGSLDEVRIYNRALSAGDVLKLYNAYPHP